MCGSILKKETSEIHVPAEVVFAVVQRPVSALIKTCSGWRKFTDNSNWQYKSEKETQTIERRFPISNPTQSGSPSTKPTVDNIIPFCLLLFVCYFGKQTWGIKICTVDSYNKQSTGDTFTCLSWVEIRPAIARELPLPHTNTFAQVWCVVCPVGSSKKELAEKKPAKELPTELAVFTS